MERALPHTRDEHAICLPQAGGAHVPPPMIDALRPRSPRPCGNGIIAGEVPQTLPLSLFLVEERLKSVQLQVAARPTAIPGTFTATSSSRK
jgi:hypothetical protein